jgi:tRNA A37 N6-isopentenylltransferase MiaA
LKEEIRTFSTEKLLKILKEKDKKILEKIHKNNRNYLERAVEVCLSGKKKSE